MLTPPRNNSQIIPAGLEQFHSFINWRYEWDAKREEWAKVPCDVHGRKIDAHDQSKWLSAEAASLSEHPPAFVIFRQSGIFCVDLDKAWDGVKWSDQALEVLSMFPGAAIEVSASGQGLHIFGRGSHAVEPDHKTRDSKHPGVELYTDKRFMALTGTGKAGSALVDCSAALPGLVARFGLVRDDSTAPALLDPSGAVLPRDSRYTGPEDDAALLKIMETTKGGLDSQMDGMPRVWDLFTGDAAVIAKKYPQPNRPDGCPFDRSSADAALMYHLSYFTGRDTERMERLFRASALYRPGHYEGKCRYRMDNIVGAAVMKNPKVYDVQKPQAVPALPMPVEVKDFSGMGVAGLEIKALDLPAQKFHVEGLLPCGNNLLVAKPKIGKSWLALNLAANTTSGGWFMGRKVTKGKVIYFALEDNRRRIKSRYEMVCLKEMVVPSNDIRFITMEDDIPGMDNGFIECLRLTLQNDLLLRLVIVDTFSVVRPLSRHGEAIYSFDRRGVDPFTKLCAEFPDLTILLIHHSRKSESDDPEDMASGSTGLTAATDANFFIGRTKDELTVLHGSGREIERFDWAIEIKPPHFEVLGDVEDTIKNANNRKIISVLTGADQPMTAKEISDEADVRYNNTHRILTRLLKHRKISKHGNRFCLA